MPVILPEQLPATQVLKAEQEDCVIGFEQTQRNPDNTRTLGIALLNLMPTKIETETQIARMLSKAPLRVRLDLLRTESHEATNSTAQHMADFYRPTEEVRNQRYDGLIITGAPVEQMPFEDVDYWDELQTVMEWAEDNVSSTLFLCWGAQAGLYHHYGINKRSLANKAFGVFPHRILDNQTSLMNGFGEEFIVPHARHTEVLQRDIEEVKELGVVAVSNEVGVHLVASHDASKVFAFGHLEYDSGTLKYEYERDNNNGSTVQLPKNYFPDDDPSKTPPNTWRDHGFLFFSNWLNHINSAQPRHNNFDPTCSVLTLYG